MVKIQHFKVTSLPSNPKPNSIYWIKASVDFEVSGYITDLQGVAYPLKDLTLNFNPGDYDLNEFTNISLDPFARVSDIVSGSGITSIVAGTNISIDNTDPLNPIVSVSGFDYEDLTNIPSSFTPSAHTHTESDITDLDKYTQSEVDTLLANKFDNPTGNNTQYLDGTGTPTTFPTIPSITGLVPYTGATTNVDLGEHQLKAGQIELDQTPTGDLGVGKIRWNDSAGTAEIRLKGNNVTLQLGQELVKRVVNKTATNITLQEANYQVVKISGATGQRLSVDLAQADSDLNSATTIGVVTEDIANNQEGFITYSGEVNSINTTGSLQGETWTDGDILYLSPTTPGAVTNVKPTAPNHSVVVGYVEYAHINNGKIFVKVDNGYEIGELHDVDTTESKTTPIDADAILIQDSEDSSVWKKLTFTNLKTWLDTYFSATKIRTILGITTLSGSNTGDDATNTTSNSYADAKVADTITNGVTTVAPSQNAVFDALILKQDILTTIDYSGTSTIVGFSSINTNFLMIQDFNGFMIINYQISGTSNATNFTFTIPFSVPLQNFRTAYVRNNGSFVTTPALISANDTTVTIFNGTTTFTASGTKSAYGSLILFKT